MRETYMPPKRGFGLRLIITLFVFFTMLVSLGIIGLVSFALVQLGIVAPLGSSPNPILPIITMFVFSLLLSTVLTAMGSNRMLKPLRKVIDAMHTVAEGDFTVQLEVGRVPELDGLNRSFNKMVVELGSIETLRNDFISNFSHEFKTPIVSIRGFAKLLKDKSLPEEDREEYTDIIIRESERLAGLATNVLNLSKIENITILANKKRFSLDEQIRRAGALIEPRWKAKGITVDSHMEEVSICADEALLQQVWMNLLDNAIKFTNEGGHILITLKEDGEYAVCEIEDDGCGMDEGALAHVFDKFYQADTSRMGVGNGLGLSLVQRAVRLSEGKVEVESSPGNGSKFIVSLPME